MYFVFLYLHLMLLNVHEASYFLLHTLYDLHYNSYKQSPLTRLSFSLSFFTENLQTVNSSVLKTLLFVMEECYKGLLMEAPTINVKLIFKKKMS